MRQSLGGSLIRLWPPVGVVAMLLLGWAVGPDSTAVDDWFSARRDSPARWLVILSDPRLLAPVLAAVVAVALYRRWWRVAAVTAVFPPAGYLLVQLIKPLFGRQRGGALAYPSGHETVTVVAMGMVVLVAGAAWWAVLLAVAVSALAMVGISVTFHYFTDTVGAVLLGTAVVCVAALLARADLTHVKPDAICVTCGD